MVQLNVGRLTAGENLRVPRVVALLQENGGDAPAPDLFDRVEDAQLIIDHYIPLCWIKALHIGKFPLLVDINERAAVEGRPEPGALDLPGLEYRVAIGEDDRGTPLLDVLDGIKRACIETVGKRIIDEPARHPQHPWVVHLLKPESFQCTEVVGIAELTPQPFENVPVKLAGWRWTKRIHKIISILETVINYDMLYIGGGNARLIEPPLPANVKTVSNVAGITGGVRLWDRRMGHAFAEQTLAFAEQPD